MNLKEQLKEQASMHPLDIDTEMFNKAVIRIEVLESALIQVTEANQYWSVPMTLRSTAAIKNIISSVERSK